MMLKKDFTVKKTDKVISWIFAAVITVIVLASLGNWIATSFGTFDDDMQSIFNKAMDTPFWRGWSSYTICDGYIAMVAYIVPCVVLLYESLVIFSKKKKPNWWFARHAKSSYTAVFWFFVVLYEIIIIVVYWGFNWKDIGFGSGYNPEFGTGPEYQLPEFIVSIVIANLVFFGLSWYFHFRLAKRQDFLELKIWRRIVAWILFLVINYIVDLIMKWGMFRPYWYQVHWFAGYTGPQTYGSSTFTQDWLKNYDANQTTPGGYHVTGMLEKFMNYYGTGKGTPYYYYMHNDIWDGLIGTYDKNTGLKTLRMWPADKQNWYWFDVSARSLGTTDGLAFPSGHMIATPVCALVPALIMFPKPRSKKEKITNWALSALGIIYVIDMLFALQCSSSHWWSDSTFTLAFLPLFFAAGWYASDGIFNWFNKRFLTRNW